MQSLTAKIPWCRGELDEITDDTIEVMRGFGDALENRVVLGTYKAQ